MADDISPRLFGLSRTNRDFSQKETWGKNQFNSSFPAALCCYLFSKNIPANYLCVSDGGLQVSSQPLDRVFKINPLDESAYFAFEAQYSPYQRFVIGSLPRIDLVIQNANNGECLAGLEVKLTALPDNTTCDFGDEYYGSEIVVRPDTIVYLACSIASRLGDEIKSVLPDVDIQDWTSPASVLQKIDQIVSAIEIVSKAMEVHQTSFLVQPIWKTKGKSPELAEHCLDVFVWSDAAFASFIASISNRNSNSNGINRQTRTAVWLYRMLLDIKECGRFDHADLIDKLSYNTKNDKAFASAGNVTNRYMQCDRLVQPIIRRDEIKNIVLGGGQNMLSPERRFDAILFNSPNLFL